MKRHPKVEEKKGKIDGSNSIALMKKKKGKSKRLGGGGLSLEAFANAKSTSNYYNPALIKKQREFYKNAKQVSKYKKSIKQQNQHNDISLATDGPFQDDNEMQEGSQKNQWNDKGRKKGMVSLREVYEKKRQEEEKERMEREAVIQAKNEERQKAEARRKSMKEKMLKKTPKGQPVMKHRIEHLLETIQGSMRK